jgi:hypothetical protein
MAREVINVGSAPNDGTGDPLRTAFEKSNSNFSELYAYDQSGWLGQPTRMEPGAFIGNEVGGVTLSTLAQTANRIVGTPKSFPRDTQVDQLGVSVSTAVAGALFRVQIYDTDADGRPTTLLVESADISGATAATVFATLGATFTFLAGKTYFIAVHSSANATLRTISTTGVVGFSWSNAATPAQYIALVRTATFGSAGNWPAFANSQAQNVAMPLVLMRCA